MAKNKKPGLANVAVNPALPSVFDINIQLMINGKMVTAQTRRFQSNVVKRDFASELADVVWCITDEFVFKVRGDKKVKGDEPLPGPNL